MTARRARNSGALHGISSREVPLEPHDATDWAGLIRQALLHQNLTVTVFRSYAGDALPVGAQLLAVSSPSPNQPFRFGSAYGFQLPLELDAETVDAMTPRLPACLPAGVSILHAEGERIAQSRLTVLRRRAAKNPPTEVPQQFR